MHSFICVCGNKPPICQCRHRIRPPTHYALASLTKPQYSSPHVIYNLAVILQIIMHMHHRVEMTRLDQTRDTTALQALSTAPRTAAVAAKAICSRLVSMSTFWRAATCPTYGKEQTREWVAIITRRLQG